MSGAQVGVVRLAGVAALALVACSGSVARADWDVSINLNFGWCEPDPCFVPVRHVTRWDDCDDHWYRPGYTTTTTTTTSGWHGYSSTTTTTTYGHGFSQWDDDCDWRDRSFGRPSWSISFGSRPSHFGWSHRRPWRGFSWSASSWDDCGWSYRPIVVCPPPVIVHPRPIVIQRPIIVQQPVIIQQPVVVQQPVVIQRPVVVNTQPVVITPSNPTVIGNAPVEIVARPTPGINPDGTLPVELAGPGINQPQNRAKPRIITRGSDRGLNGNGIDFSRQPVQPVQVVQPVESRPPAPLNLAKPGTIRRPVRGGDFEVVNKPSIRQPAQPSVEQVGPGLSRGGSKPLPAGVVEIDGLTGKPMQPIAQPIAKPAVSAPMEQPTSFKPSRWRGEQPQVSQPINPGGVGGQSKPMRRGSDDRSVPMRQPQMVQPGGGSGMEFVGPKPMMQPQFKGDGQPMVQPQAKPGRIRRAAQQPAVEQAKPAAEPAIKRSEGADKKG
jgi:hypothetical protein